MKTLLSFAILILFTLSLTAQNPSDSSFNLENEFVLNKTTGQSYEHLYFPKVNFIIKKGGIPNFNALAGVKVQIESVNEDSNLVYLRRVDGKKFFNRYKRIQANLEKAISSGELTKVNP